MTPRGRRLAAALLLLAAALFVGRWLAVFLTDRWWAGVVSPPAVFLLARRSLIRLGLELAGVGLALVWFAAHARAALAVMRSVPAHLRAGNPVLRELVGRRSAALVAMAVALVLAILVGSGAGQWVDAVTLAARKIQLGIADPALGRDAGWYLSRLPVWIRLQAFATVLVVISFGLVLGLYLLSGAIRVVRGVAITEEARAHLGMLLALLALVIGSSQILSPYELAAGLPVPVATGVVELRRSVAFVLVGVSLAVAVLSVIWAMRPLHSLVAGAWLALSAALVGAYYLLPDAGLDLLDGDTRAGLAEFERVGFGLATTPRPRSATAFTPSLWDETALVKLRPDSVSGAALVPVRGVRPTAGGKRPVWVLVLDGSDSLRVLAVADDSAGPTGEPLTWRVGVAGPEPGLEPLLSLGRMAVRPGGPGVATGSGPGVRAGNFFRRAVLAWALQAPAAFTAPERVSWLLDPVERLAHLAPFADWHDVRPWFDSGRLRWVADGYVTADAFPVARRRPWGTRSVAYLQAGFIGVVDADSGTAALYLRPGAGPLAQAWAEASGALVRPTAQLPPALAGELGYPASLLRPQASLFATARSAATAADSVTLHLPVGVRLPGVGPAPGRWVVPVVDRRTGRLDVLLEGARVEGTDRLLEYLPDSTLAPEAPDVLARRWQRFPFVQQLRDSVVAAGGTFEPGRVRYALGEDGLVAYQPSWSIPAQGAPTLILVTVARGDGLGAGRNLEDAWRSSRGDATEYLRLSDDAAIRAEARRWMREADSALRRGDLVGFGRALSALRQVLEGEATAPPK